VLPSSKLNSKFFYNNQNRKKLKSNNKADDPCTCCISQWSTETCQRQKKLSTRTLSMILWVRLCLISWAVTYLLTYLLTYCAIQQILINFHEEWSWVTLNCLPNSCKILEKQRTASQVQKHPKITVHIRISVTKLLHCKL